MRHLGIVWSPGYPRGHDSGPFFPPILQRGEAASLPFPAQLPGVVQLTIDVCVSYFDDYCDALLSPILQVKLCENVRELGQPRLTPQE